MTLGRRMNLILATGLGSGYSSFAPGTVGSLLGLPLVWGLKAAPLSPVVYALTTIAIFLIGVPICTAACNHFALKDPGAVVFDEIAAFPITFALTPVDSTSAIVGFLLFRFFDIWKPWPIRRLEFLPSGWGVMADDALAGVFAGLCLYGVMMWMGG